ncbi:hypothetical protein AB3S75_013141 [Citrus x aurantiifolia]
MLIFRPNSAFNRPNSACPNSAFNRPNSACPNSSFNRPNSAFKDTFRSRNSVLFFNGYETKKKLRRFQLSFQGQISQPKLSRNSAAVGLVLQWVRNEKQTQMKRMEL